MQSVVGMKEAGFEFWHVVFAVSFDGSFAALSVALSSCSVCILHACPAVSVLVLNLASDLNPKTYHVSVFSPRFAATAPATPAATIASTATGTNKNHQRDIDPGCTLPPCSDPPGLEGC